MITYINDIKHGHDRYFITNTVDWPFHMYIRIDREINQRLRNDYFETSLKALTVSKSNIS